MAITRYQTTRFRNITTVAVISDLSGTVYYHWYLDGAYIASTTRPTYSFVLEQGEQARIEVQDTTDPNYDPIANAPAGYPARRTLWWIRSTEGDVDYYKVEQKKDSGQWSTIGIVRHDNREWAYSFLTPRLEDLATYTWRIIPVDTAGNEGTPQTIGPETVVRTPDAPRFAISFDPSTTRVTFSAAA